MSLFFECADITKVEIHYIRKALFWFESSFFFFRVMKGLVVTIYFVIILLKGILLIYQG